MSEKPILFSGPMVRAILDGAKTQTRRLVKQQVGEVVDGVAWWPAYYEVNGNPGSEHQIPSPVSVGDTLWVRETWRVGGLRDPVIPRYEDRGDVARSPGLIAVDYAASPEIVRTPWQAPPPDVYARLNGQVCERAASLGVTSWGHGESPDRWRPSIHMPRWASRLTLRVTDVRVERLGDISKADACAEGLRLHAAGWTDGAHVYDTLSARDAFAELWDTVHGDGAWERDRERWVWVYAFEVCR